VVRADMRTGKLVRSAVVAPKPVLQQRVDETRVAEKVMEPRVIAPMEVGEAPAPAASGGPQGIGALVDSIASQHGLQPQLVHSVIKVESGYNPNAVSPKGALGLMQLIPATARRFGVSDAFNPAENIQGGVRYLAYLLDLFHNDYSLALAAYNAGEAAVVKYGGVPPYTETRNYLVQVGKRLQEVEKASEAAARQKQKEARAAEAKPDAPRQIEQIRAADGTVRYVAQ
jgi:soluble lytic murein transglycosylase-like protein